MNTHLDYLRLASWEPNAYTETIARAMLNWPDNWEQSGWLQYKGWRKEGFFIGHGLQQNKSHTIINVSGSLAHKMLPTLRELEHWYATRIDLQITVDASCMGDDTLAIVRDHCQTQNTTLIESMDNDTLYLGSRTSDTFTRLYEKILEMKKYLRLEFELKGQRSRACWQAITNGEPLDKIFKFYNKRSKLPDNVIEWFNAYGVSATHEAMINELKQSERLKLEWLQSLDSAVMRYMNSHEIGDAVKELIRAWGKHADFLDRSTPIE